MARKKKYSVLLLYPFDGNDTPESYFTNVEAYDARSAERQAQDQAVNANPEGYDHEDFYPLLTIRGHHDAV